MKRILANCGMLACAITCAEQADVQITALGPAYADLGQSAPLDPTKAATAWRFIGVKGAKSTACPGAVGFRVRELFATGSRSQPPPGLFRYCLYENDQRTLGVASLPRELLALVGDGRLQRVEPDHAALATASLMPLVAKTFGDAFSRHAGRLATLPPLSTKTGPMRLAVLDTTPTASLAPHTLVGHGAHGFSLLNMARALTCDASGTCVAALSSRLATPLRYGPKGDLVWDPLGGGHFGTIAWLAETVRGEVEAWTLAGSPAHLILNVSLGWLDVYGGVGQEAAPLDVTAVYDALADATCRGVLVIAAAGNQSGGPSHQAGPLYPAAWEVLAAPGSAECSKRLGVASLGASGAFVYAVGGVDSMGADLASARPKARPMRVAHGDHATTTGPLGEPVPTLTGTSVSTVVTAAAAAVVWSYRPELSPAEVMKVVYAGGEPVGSSADFCLGAPACGVPVHRVDVCNAVRAACSGGGSGCPPPSNLPECAKWLRKPWDFTTVDFSGFKSTATALAPAYPFAPESAAICGGRALYNVAPGLAPEPCPDLQYYAAAAEPWVETQPGQIGCPNCVIEANSSTLLLSSDVTFLGPTTLTIDGTTTYALPASSAGDLYVTISPPIPSGTTEATLTQTDGMTSYTSPLAVAP